MMKEKPFGAGAIVLMLFIATLVDGLELFLTFVGIGILINPLFMTPLAWMAFGTILFAHHKPIIQSPRPKVPSGGLALAVTLIIGFIPFLDAFPNWIGYAIYLIATDKIQGIERNGV